MLFRSDIKPSCAYCLYGTYLGYGEVACKKRGIMYAEGNCNAFRYEPTKREPEFTRSQTIQKLSEEEFSI